MTDPGEDLKLIRFLVTLRARKNGYRCEEVGPDVLALTGPDGQPQEVSLASLRQAATALPRSEWATAVNEFVDGTLNPTFPDDENLETIRPLLRTRLVPEEAAQQLSTVCEDFGQGLVEGLILDRPLTMEWVERERASRWSAREHELLRQGRENVRAAGRLDVETVEVGGVPVTMLSGDDYASTHLFWLDEYGLVGTHGTLVSVPSRTKVLAAPIVAGTTGFNYLTPMVRLTMAIYDDAKDPLMARVYHWEPDTMEMLDQVLSAAMLQLTDDGLLVIVNPAFQESQEALTS